MISPADMKIIQIDITNACDKRCSNCTRFCGNHKKPFFMGFETFGRAVDSLAGYEGIVGIMGGEPTLHPEFERFLLYLQEKFGAHKKNRRNWPQRGFIEEVRRGEFESRVLRKGKNGCRKLRMHGVGLWSNMGATYRKHYEMIQDTFDVQFLNDHINPSYHQPGLFARRDLGIPDVEWRELRDKCWVQNEWSATITPKGAFFCEEAGALDMLFDGPGGWPIEPGWWKRTPKEFGDQLHWCELCGFALDTFMRDAGEEKDDVSPTLYEMLEKAESPGIKSGRTHLVKIEDGVIAEESKASNRKHFSASQPYIENYEDRFNEANSVLFANGYMQASIPEGDGFGRGLNKVLAEADEWIVLRTDTSKPADEAGEMLERHILNPGTLHLGDGFALFNKRASFFRKFGYDRIARTSSLDDIVFAWNKDKVIRLDEIKTRLKWTHDTIVKDKRYVIWGAGQCGGFIADIVKDSGGGLAFMIDRDAEKEGTLFSGAVVHVPEYLCEHMDDFDILIIAHYDRFDEILEEARKTGMEMSRIMMPYEI